MRFLLIISILFSSYNIFADAQVSASKTGTASGDNATVCTLNSLSDLDFDQTEIKTGDTASIIAKFTSNDNEATFSNSYPDALSNTGGSDTITLSGTDGSFSSNNDESAHSTAERTHSVTRNVGEVGKDLEQGDYTAEYSATLTCAG